MAITIVDLTNTFDVWRTRTNQVITLLNGTDSNLISFKSNSAAINLSPSIAPRGVTVYLDASLSLDVNDVSTVNIASANVVNTNRVIAINAYNSSNTAYIQGNNAYNQANAAIGAIVTANATISSAFAQANSAIGAIVTANATISSAFAQANAAIGAIVAANANISSAFARANAGPQITADSISATRYLVFANNTTGYLNRANVNSSLSYDPSAGELSSDKLYVGGGSIWTTTNQINSGKAVNALDQLAIQYAGYNGGITQFRDTKIFNGKNGSVALFQGSDQSLYVWGNITGYYSSDARLKTNIKNIENALNKVQQINGVEFDWADEYLEKAGGENSYFNRKHDIGVIAQEIETVLPEVVGTREDGIKAVKYERIVPLLIEAIKELKAEIEELKKR